MDLTRGARFIVAVDCNEDDNVPAPSFIAHSTSGELPLARAHIHRAHVSPSCRTLTGACFFVAAHDRHRARSFDTERRNSPPVSTRELFRTEQSDEAGPCGDIFSPTPVQLPRKKTKPADLPSPVVVHSSVRQKPVQLEFQHVGGELRLASETLDESRAFVSLRPGRNTVGVELSHDHNAHTLVRPPSVARPVLLPCPTQLYSAPCCTIFVEEDGRPPQAVLFSQASKSARRVCVVRHAADAHPGGGAQLTADMPYFLRCGDVVVIHM